MEARDLRIKTEALVHACVVSEMENGGGGPLGLEVSGENEDRGGEEEQASLK